MTIIPKKGPKKITYIQCVYETVLALAGKRNDKSMKLWNIMKDISSRVQQKGLIAVETKSTLAHESIWIITNTRKVIDTFMKFCE